MRRLRATRMTIVAVALLLGCSGGGARSAPAAPAASTTSTVVRVVRGQSLALHAMAYLASNPVSPMIGLFARASATIVVGSPSDVLVQLRPGLTSSPVWVSMQTRRLTVDAQAGPGRIMVSTDGCPSRGTARCKTPLVFAPTAFPIGPAPAGGVVTNRGFTLHVATAALQPDTYEMTLPIRYASNVTRTNVLDVTDTLHIRLDVGDKAPTTRCTVADLHRPARTMPTPHALTATVVFTPGDERLDPPPPGAKARIPAIVAWRHLSSHDGGSGGTNSLVFALVTTVTPARPIPNGAYAEEVHDVPAWVLYTHNVAVASGLIAHSPLGPVGTTARPAVTSPPCQFLDGLGAMNATTGQEILGRGGTAEHDPIRL